MRVSTHDVAHEEITIWRRIALKPHAPAVLDVVGGNGDVGQRLDQAHVAEVIPVDGLDFGAFRTAFNTNNPIFDFDGNGIVDGLDFGQFRTRFGVVI